LFDSYELSLVPEHYADGGDMRNLLDFSARQHATARPSVRLCVRLSHGWISQKRLKLGSCNFHHK